MADDNIGNASDVAFQRHVTTLVLDQIGSAGFALAGSGAIREHGITDRPTNDVDLFTTTATSPETFAAAVAQAEDALTSHGYRVTRTRITPEFARILIEAGFSGDAPSVRAVEVDFGIDWRNEPPAQLAIGPVLALRDAVGSKVAAVYSRGEARDFLDLDAIRGSGRFTDHDLLTLAKEHDPGFEVGHFIGQLQWVNRIAPGRTSPYGVNADHLEQIKTRLTAWAEELAAPRAAAPTTSNGTPASRESSGAASRPALPRTTP